MAGSLEEQAGDERDGGFQPADQQLGEAHEADDLADRGLALEVQAGAEHDDGDDGDGAGGARQHVDQRPPVQHRELVVDHLADDVAEQPRLGCQPGEGLHHHDVGQRVLRGAGQLESGSVSTWPLRRLGLAG